MKVKMMILEVDHSPEIASRVKHDMDILQNIGSSARFEGEVIEGLTVPKGKIWLFTSGGGFERLEKHIVGKRIIQTVNVD
jgi:hypothetical protein